MVKKFRSLMLICPPPKVMNTSTLVRYPVHISHCRQICYTVGPGDLKVTTAVPLLLLFRLDLINT